MDQDQDDPKSIGVLSRGLSASSDGCRSLSAAVAPTTDPVVAVERARVMFGCYRKGDAADPETYAAAIAAVLADFPLDTVLRVTNPVHGLPSRLNWLPTVKEVREACDVIEQRKQLFFERRQLEQSQIEARQREEKSRDQRPTYDELKAKHGHNWGFKAEEPRANETMKRANKIMFERECEAAGMPADSPISPSLASLIKAGMA